MGDFESEISQTQFCMLNNCYFRQSYFPLNSLTNMFENGLIQKRTLSPLTPAPNPLAHSRRVTIPETELIFSLSVLSFPLTIFWTVNNF